LGLLKTKYFFSGTFLKNEGEGGQVDTFIFSRQLVAAISQEPKILKNSKWKRLKGPKITLVLKCQQEKLIG
jgi:hypothetical protein